VKPEEWSVSGADERKADFPAQTEKSAYLEYELLNRRALLLSNQIEGLTFSADQQLVSIDRDGHGISSSSLVNRL